MNPFKMFPFLHAGLMHELHLNHTILIGYWKIRKASSFKLQDVFVCSRVWSDNKISSDSNSRSPCKHCKSRVHKNGNMFFARLATGPPVSAAGRGGRLPLPPYYPFPTKNFPCITGESSETRGSYNWKLDCSLTICSPCQRMLCAPPVLHCVTLCNITWCHQW